MNTSTTDIETFNTTPTLLRFLSVNLDRYGLDWKSKADGYWDFSATAGRPFFRVVSDTATGENFIVLWDTQPRETPQWALDILSDWQKAVELFPNKGIRMFGKVEWRYGHPRYADEPSNVSIEHTPPTMVQFLRLYPGRFELVEEGKQESSAAAYAAGPDRPAFVVSNNGTGNATFTIWTSEAKHGVPGWVDAMVDAYRQELEIWLREPQAVNLRVRWVFRAPSTPEA